MTRWHVAVRAAAAMLVVLAVWEIAARTLFAGSYSLSPPTSVAGRIVDEWELYWNNLLVTLEAAGWGYLWGNLAAIILAVVAVEFSLFDRLVHRVALTVFCLPLVAVAPILRVVYGPGSGPQITLAALAVSFTTLVAVVLGMRSTSQASLDLVHVYGGSRAAALRKVKARAAVPGLIAGLQIAAPAAFLGALVGEFTGASEGFGILLIGALRTLEPDRVWAVALVSTVAATLAYWGIGKAGTLLTRWAPEVSVSPPPARRERGDRLATWGRRFVRMAVAVGVVLGLWIAFLELFALDDFFAKRPSEVWAYLFTEPEAAAQRNELLDALWVTLSTAALGFVAGLLLAVVLAVLFLVFPIAETALMPAAIALRSVPIIATVPLLILLFGRGVLGTTVIVAVMVFFPTLVNVAYGMRSAPVAVIDVMRAYDAPTRDVIWRARLPAALPALFASARIAVPASILAATVAEWLATGKGIGNLMVIASGTARYDVLWSAVVLLTIAAVAVHAMVSMTETAVLSRVAPEQVGA